VLETELRRDGEHVEFVVRTERPPYQDRLLKMGWARTAEPRCFARRLGAATDVDRIFERFSRRIDTMIAQSAR
jgi:hypothetical protein